MKICLLCADRGISLAKHNGAAANIRNLVRALHGLGHDVLVIMSSAEDSDDLGVPVVAIPTPEILEVLLSDAHAAAARLGGDRSGVRMAHALGHIWNNVAVETLLRDVLASYRPDLLLERYSPFGVAGGIIAKRMGIRHILNAHAPLAWEGKQYRRQALQEAAHALEQAAFNTASCIVTNSQELRDELLALGVTGDKVQVVSNGVDADMFTPDGPANNQGLEHKIVIGFVGSLNPWHGIDILASAFRELANEGGVHLLVVGHGPMAKEIQVLGEDLPGSVSLIGAVPQAEVPAYIRAMDIAIAPYPPLERFYYSPLKVLEYMACGRAVVAVGIGQIIDLISDGDTGVLVSPGDTSALANAVRRLIADKSLRRALGMRASAEVRRAHTWPQRAAEIVDLAQAMA